MIPSAPLRYAILFLSPLLWPLVGIASEASPTGVWETIDDSSGDPSALVKITEQDGELRGRIVALITPSEPDPTCDACEGKRHGKPIEGMEILWGLTREDGAWTGGHILDPENGTIYDAHLSLGDDGETLDVRGYVGVSLLGRTQTWRRRQDETSE